MDIALQRNEDYARIWQFADDATGQRIDLTGRQVTLQVRQRLENGGAPLTTATVTVTDAANGEAEVFLRASSGPLATYGDPLHTVLLPYDATIRDPADDVTVALVSGHVILSRGVTHA